MSVSGTPDRMSQGHKFDPARAHLLDSPERERYLPTDVLVDALELRGDERVVDYGAGTGRVALAVAGALDGGEVVAVDENREMYDLLAERAGDAVRPLLIADNSVPRPDGSADRVVAVNLLHEVRGEGALAEIRRLLAPGGFVLVVDWQRGHTGPAGPPDDVLYSAEEACEELRTAGFEACSDVDGGLPFHFALKATPTRGT